jgi:hypothetical protein
MVGTQKGRCDVIQGAYAELAFMCSVSSTGEEIILVADTISQKGHQNISFRMTPALANDLAKLLTGNVKTAKERRKAIKRAAKPQPKEST